MFDKDSDIYLINIDKLAYCLENDSNDYKCNFYMNSFNYFDFSCEDFTFSIENLFAKAGKFILEQLKKLWNLIKRIGLFIWNGIKAFCKLIGKQITFLILRLKNLQNREQELKSSSVEETNYNDMTIMIHDYINKKNIGNFLSNYMFVEENLIEFGNKCLKINKANAINMVDNFRKKLSDIYESDGNQDAKRYLDDIDEVTHDYSVYGGSVDVIYKKLNGKMSLSDIKEILHDADFIKFSDSVNNATEANAAMKLQDMFQFYLEYFEEIFDVFELDDNTPFNKPEFIKLINEKFFNLFYINGDKDKMVDVELKEVVTDQNLKFNANFNTIKQRLIALRNHSIDIDKFNNETMQQLNRYDKCLEIFIERMKKRKKRFFSKTKPDIKSNPSGDHRVDEFLTSKRHEKWNGKDYDNESIIKDATGELMSYKFNQAFSMIFANVTQLLIKNELVIINSYMRDINELANKCSKFNKV